MSSCRDEHDGHEHGHDGHDGHDDHGEHHHEDGSHDHDDSYERGLEFSLYKYVNTEKVRCLNAVENGQRVACFRPWDQRLNPPYYLESDADEQLILHVPFTGSVTLKGFVIIGGTERSCPKSLKIFVNRDDIDFDNVTSITPVQEWDLHEDFNGRLEYQTRISKFQNVTSITMFFPDNFGNDVTKINFIGLKGDWKELKKDPIITIYEAKANPADHKVKDNLFQSNSVQ